MEPLDHVPALSPRQAHPSPGTTPLVHEELHGHRRLHPHRQQRLADIEELTPVPAELRAEQGDRPEGRGARARLRPVDDQTQGLRRRDRVLGPQPGVVHADGRPGRRHGTDQALRLHPDPRPAPGDRRAHGLDHRLDRPRPLRHQHRHRLGPRRVLPDGPLAGRRPLRQPLRPRRRVRHRDEGTVERGRQQLQGRVLRDGRLRALTAPGGRAHRHRRRRTEQHRHPVRRRTRRVQLHPGQRRQHPPRPVGHHGHARRRGGRDRP